VTCGVLVPMGVSLSLPEHPNASPRENIGETRAEGIQHTSTPLHYRHYCRGEDGGDDAEFLPAAEPNNSQPHHSPPLTTSLILLRPRPSSAVLVRTMLRDRRTVVVLLVVVVEGQWGRCFPHPSQHYCILQFPSASFQHWPCSPLLTHPLAPTTYLPAYTQPHGPHTASAYC